MNHDPSVHMSNEVTESVTLDTFSTPSHDPFCPCVINPATVRSPDGGTKIIIGNYCQCDLISKVREIEYKKAFDEGYNKAVSEIKREGWFY